MSTIQIRNLPDEVHRVYQTRAAAAGMSLQEYLRAELVRNACMRSPSELAMEVKARMLTEGVETFAHVSAAGVIRDDRTLH